MTRFTEIGIISGEHNCSLARFCQQSHFLSIFLVQKSIINDSSGIYSHSYNSGRALTRSLERPAMTRSVAMPSYLGALSAGNLYCVGRRFLL